MKEDQPSFTDCKHYYSRNNITRCKVSSKWCGTFHKTFNIAIYKSVDGGEC